MNTDISIAISVMNRTDRIISCLASWLNFPNINDIVIVDWSSKKPILEDPTINSFIKNTSIIRTIRVDNEEYFSLPKSYNLAIDNTFNPNILKIDIDHILYSKKFPELLEQLIPKLSTNFYCCEHVTVEHWGICFFDKTAFYEIGMYNERLSGWGYDDQDLYDRLCKIRKKNIMKNIPNLVYHNPHGDDLRVANYQVKDKFESHRINELIARGKL
jgi:predicted glycosyltransferase involved in capsule biosynthesis